MSFGLRVDLLRDLRYAMVKEFLGVAKVARAANYTRVYNEDAPGGGEAQNTNRAVWDARIKNAGVFRHNNGQNITYADGHSKYRVLGQITSGNDWIDGRHATEGTELRDS